jgi:indolepyruvate ferredoxin oxidoreductase
MNEPLSPALRAALSTVTLEDKFTQERGRVYLNGTQALVRLLMLQRQRDLAAGLNTAGFVSGYRGSPLGSVDQTLWRAQAHLQSHHISFQPGVNEDLAATSVWGSQQVNMYPGARYDGVFGMWYGKGPGVDRCGDVFKHANAAGTSPHGGVLVLAGDDHAAKSSTLPHQSDHVLKACGIPVFYPSTVQEYLDLGLHAYAMSRYSGLWVGFKVVTDVVESSASIELDPDRVQIRLPDDFIMPPGGLNIRWPDAPLDQEARLLDFKWYAALAYVRANRLNRTVIDSPHARFGIVSAGKAYLDTCQALEDLGLDAATCARIGVRVFKVGVVWPLDAHDVRTFATGLEEILVVEEKRQIIEYQLKEELYNWRDDVRPRVFGKFDDNGGKDGGEWAIPQGRWLLPAHYELTPAIIARAIATRLAVFALPAEVRARIEARMAIIDVKEKALARPRLTVERKPYFCSGCPHNTSTNVPEGSRAVAGIGCHYMSIWMDRRTSTFSHMGGEGASWIGQAPFTDCRHVFANIGDGTYFHSGYLAIRAAVASKVNITYKILFNDAVAMTGGQPVDGQLTVPKIVAQMAAEGVGKIVVVSDEPEKYPRGQFAANVEVFHRDDLDTVQRQLRDIPGCTVLLYDQTCASEKRRRRKKIVDGKPSFPDPAKRAFINDAVCEGCGDCSVKSNCLSVEPLETPLGRKRRINQSSCNKDFSCVNGFCPSFVTLEGGSVRRGRSAAAPAGADAQDSRFADLPEAALPALERPWRVLVTGVGGTGVVTIGQWLAMAAHLEAKAVTALDMAGLAQKGGAVASHVQLASHPEQLHATRIATGEADLVIGCDLLVTAGNEYISRMRAGHTRGVINSAHAPTADFVHNPDWQFPGSNMEADLKAAMGEQCDFIDAASLSVGLMGDAIYTNPLMLGYAWQKGWLPLTRAALERAIELNAVSVAQNLKAFLWGRRAAVDLEAVRRIATPAEVIELRRGSTRAVETLDELISTREQFLTAYQNPAYARRYRHLVDKVRHAETALGGSRLTTAVAGCLFKLMAYKDEYEVARLYTEPAFMEKIRAQFEGDYVLKFHLAPPLLARRDAAGHLIKREFGPWMMHAFGVLARLRFLRGTRLDVFGYSAERRAERALVVEYEQTLLMMLSKLDTANLDMALQVASLPEQIRGFGHVKEASMAAAAARRLALLEAFKAPVHALGATGATGKVAA